MVELFAYSGDPDQTLHSAVSDLGLHCLLNTLLGFPDYNELNSVRPITSYGERFLEFVKSNTCKHHSDKLSILFYFSPILCSHHWLLLSSLKLCNFKQLKAPYSSKIDTFLSKKGFLN